MIRTIKRQSMTESSIFTVQCHTKNVYPIFLINANERACKVIYESKCLAFSDQPLDRHNKNIGTFFTKSSKY